MSPQDAVAYDTHVVPRYSSLFGRMLLSEIPIRERLQVLDVGCGTGYPALDVLRKLPAGGRVIAIDPDPSLVDVARNRAHEQSGKRIFFKTDSAEKLTFSDNVFDVVIANLALSSFGNPSDALNEMRRVLVDGGLLLLTHALDGSFEEILDMFRELALKRDNKELASRVERIASRYPSAQALEEFTRTSGYENVKIKTEEFQLTFGSASEVLSDPAMRYVAMPEWRWIAEGGGDADETLSQIATTLDTYFGGGPLSVRVHAGLAVAHA